MNNIKQYQSEVSRRARIIRQLRGLSQVDVAHATGVTHALVSQFETGKIASYWLLVYYVAFLGLDLGGIDHGA